MKALDVLERAISLIHGQRAKDYGDAQASFQRMADLVNPIIKKADGKLTASDMALVMIQVKIARLQESPNHADSWIDIAGYAALGAQLAVHLQQGGMVIFTTHEPLPIPGITPLQATLSA